MHGMSQPDETFLDQAVEALRRSLGRRPVAVVLFGSRARSDAREDSDWDLLVIARELPSRSLQQYRFLKQMLPSASRGSISLLAKTPCPSRRPAATTSS